MINKKEINEAAAVVEIVQHQETPIKEAEPEKAAITLPANNWLKMHGQPLRRKRGLK